MKMKHINIGDSHDTRLPFYLAMEEWVARNLPAADYLFSWQVNPTVIFGRNQNIDTEVDLDYCHAKGIEVYRRKSGGGCVYADIHNIMFSYVTPSQHVSTTFSHYTGMIAAMLRSLGLDARVSGRNDITIGNRKVSGNAFYHIPGRSIVHGTMLYDTDLQHMSRAITPSRSKLESKQVKSVEAHITTLSRHLDMSIDEFNRYAISSLTDSEITLSANDIAEIEKLSRQYFNPSWIYGRGGSASIKRSRRIEGVGEFTTSIVLADNAIEDVDLEGDFFLLSDLDSTLLYRMKGIPYTREAISQAISSTDVSQTISGLDNDRFLELLIN